MGTSSAEMSGSAVELELQVHDRDCFFVDASAVADCHVELEQMANRSDDRLLEYFTVEGAAPERVLSMVEESPVIDEARLVGQGGDSGLFEFIVSGPCVTTTLADTRAIAKSVAAESGVGNIVAEVPGHINVRQVVERFRDSHPESEILACRESEEPIPIRTERGVHATLANQLTGKQLEVLRAAYLNGYFDWPRQSTAEECANSLGISQPTFSQHIRIAEKKVFNGLFEDRRRD
jgi:predicted DNA binding protein